MNLLIALIDFYREVVPFLRLHHIFQISLPAIICPYLIVVTWIHIYTQPPLMELSLTYGSLSGHSVFVVYSGTSDTGPSK